MNYTIFILFFILSIRIFAQQDSSSCIREVLSYEDKLYEKLDNEQTIYLNYKTTAIDWENNVASSEVKTYKNSNNIHFFSNEGLIYQDENDVFLILPKQRLIIIDKVTEEIKERRKNDNFTQLRKQFLLNSSLVFCKIIDSIQGIKEVRLRVQEELEGIIEIEEISYIYNTKTENIITTTVWYSNNYKIKKMITTYINFDKNSPYKFKKANRYVLANNKKLLNKYQSFKLIDNRSN